VISVITPCLNSLAVIGDCLDSVAGQRVAIEHLLVDGGSSDGTQQFLRKYVGSIKLLPEPVNGIYAAINAGIAAASGDIICVLNADDFYVSDDVLSVVAEAFQDLSVDAVYGDLEYVAAKNTNWVVRSWKAGSFGRGRFYNGWMLPHPCLFLRREVYERFGLYREDLGTAADYEYMLRVFVKHGIEALYLPRLLVRMRTGGASNRNLKARWRANRNDARAWQTNGLRPRPWTLAAKPLRKVGQWWLRP
jgi:glycosyltransferase